MKYRYRTRQVICISFYYVCVGDFRLLPWNWWELRSFGLLRSE